MARKTFISYKYSEAQKLRDAIIKEMGSDARYYTGETVESPNLDNETTENIKRKLKDMIYPTSVTIVILSPKMNESEWIEWEIKYCLKSIQRENRTSRINGIVGVIMKVNGSYDWLISESENCHQTKTISYDKEKICDVIYNNKFNSNPKKWHCEECKTYDSLDGGYITFVKEEDFLQDTDTYIENAYRKSENNASGYDLKIGTKEVVNCG